MFIQNNTVLALLFVLSQLWKEGKKYITLMENDSKHYIETVKGRHKF
jgi:hypothetical protein